MGRGAEGVDGRRRSGRNGSAAQLRSGKSLPRAPGAHHEERNLQHREPDTGGARARPGLRVSLRLHPDPIQGSYRLAGTADRDSLRRSMIFAVLFSALVAATPTMRLDYYHSGNASQELFSVDRIVIEPLPWPGSPAQAIDETNLGKYLFEVVDRSTNRVVFSRGFASIYGEWETTEEAARVNRTFHESLRFPAPDAPVQVVLNKRDSDNAFRDILSTLLDPEDRFIDGSRPLPPGALIEMEKNGESAAKVDFLILCDGYTASELSKFEN